MRLIFRYTILSIFCSLLAFHSAAVAQDDSAGSPSGEPAKTEKTEKTKKAVRNPNGLASVTLEDLAINFPEIENWQQSEIQKYPTEDLGFSIDYESREGGKVTIYVYKGGQKTIPDDISDKVIKNELKKAKGEIQKVADMGYYDDLKEVKNDTVTLGGTSGKIKALHALYNFRARNQNLASEIYIFGHKNRFIKIRATRSRSNNESGDKMVTDLLAEIDTFFSDETN